MKSKIAFQKETPEDLKKRIGEKAYNVTQRDMTEPPGSGRYNRFDEPGIYIDVVSGEPLFSSQDKFPSFCGWPAFSRTIEKDAVTEIEDRSYGMERVEVRSKEANSHLGHVFDDGPAELGGLRYCINSAALRFIPLAKLKEEGYGEYLSLFDEI